MLRFPLLAILALLATPTGIAPSAAQPYVGWNGPVDCWGGTSVGGACFVLGFGLFTTFSATAMTTDGTTPALRFDVYDGAGVVADQAFACGGTGTITLGPFWPSAVAVIVLDPATTAALGCGASVGATGTILASWS